MSSPSSRSRCRLMSGSVKVLLNHPTGVTSVDHRREELAQAREQRGEHVPHGASRVLKAVGQPVRVLHEPEADEQDDEESYTLLQRAVHVYSLGPEEGMRTPQRTHDPSVLPSLRPLWNEARS